MPRPGVERAPAFVCIATTVTASGHTRQSSIHRRSGNRRIDRFALYFVRTLKFLPPAGTTWEALGAVDRPGHVLVRAHANGQVAFRLFEAPEPLPPICDSPFESVAKDAEINAAIDL